MAEKGYCKWDGCITKLLACNREDGYCFAHKKKGLIMCAIGSVDLIRSKTYVQNKRMLVSIKKISRASRKAFMMSGQFRAERRNWGINFTFRGTEILC